MDALQDEELSDPIEAFAKLSQRVQDGQLDTKRGFAQTQQAIVLVQEQIEQALALVQQRAELALAKAMKAAAPDYTNDIKELKDAVQAIEKKPALAASAKSVEQAAADGAAKGSATAVASLDNARATMDRTLEQIQAGERARRQASLRAKVAVIALLVLVPPLITFGAGLFAAPVLQEQGWLPLTGIPVEQISLVRWALQFKDSDKRALAEWAVSDDGKWAKRFVEENAYLRKECPAKEVQQGKVSCRVWQVR
ncbi:hypothetical protein [Roseateles sp.]|uniref:hypothetical protein n=1 Tax=Roseateles sp. TaxID=1971397 RepID=UPI002E05F76B|nr:hypothetical protein [Roseateles sp.]